MTKKGRWATKKARKKQHQDSYKKTARERLQAMFKAGFGRSRSLDKKDDITHDKIYSKATFNTYKNQFRYFADWLEKNHSDVKTLKEAREYVDDYLRYLIELERSAYSISTAKAALAKVFQVDVTQFIGTPSRERKNVTRSRLDTKIDKNISAETEAKLARFTSATGLRRAEMTKITAEDLFFKNGKYYLNVKKGTKGGKPRVVEVIGQTDVDTKNLVRWIKSQKGKLFSKLNTNYDNHHYRAVYASRVYERYARDPRKLKGNERYIMRKDRAGEVLDRHAMLITSKNLGHNRIDVIAQSYLYTLK